MITYNGYGFVEVPEVAEGFWLPETDWPKVFWYEPNKTFGDEKFTWSTGTDLPVNIKTERRNWHKDYSIVGLAKDLSEEQWSNIVESDWWYDGPQEEHGLGKVTYYRNYPNELEDSCELSATESGLSLLKSLNLSGNILVLKIKE